MTESRLCGVTTRGVMAISRKMGQAAFRCRSCGYSANADVNADINIRAAGLAVTGRGGTPHAKPKTAQHSGPVKRQPSDLVAA